MDMILEAISSRNIFVWIFIVIALIVFVKLLQAAGKGFLLLIALVIVVVIIGSVFPEFVAPGVDFVKGGWLGD